MNIKFLAFLGLLVAIVFVGSIAASDVDLEAQTLEPTSARDRFRLPKLFNFEYFKQVFKKSYANLSEELRRQKLFLGEALRAFLSGFKYKHKLLPYYMSTNEFSDWTQKEIENLESSVVLTEDLKKVVIDKNTGNVVSEEPLAADVQIIRKELDDIKEHSSEPGYDVIMEDVRQLDKQSSEHKLKKRETDQKIRQDFSFDELIEDKPGEIPEEVIEKMNDDDEVANSGIFGYLTMPKLQNFNFIPVQAIDDARQLVADTATRIAKSIYGGKDVTQVPPKPDQIFNDYRKCMNPPRRQGLCGSCYAFASVSYWEYQVCQETGKLFKFSEQQIIDCAPRHTPNYFLGCKGGVAELVGDFYSLAGIEFAKNYPYEAEQGTCAYKNFTQFTPETAPGFLRLKDSNQLIMIELKSLDEYLKRGPIMLNIGNKNGYTRYGGGVHDGKGCCGPNHDTEHCGTHAQLLVGDGIEDGEEYWLMRNSYGTQWGENGYYKMNKKADCIHPRVGWQVGFENSDAKVVINPRINTDHKVWRKKLF